MRSDLKPASVHNKPLLNQQLRDQVIGVALIKSVKSQRIMIEKYENANNTENTTIYTNAAQALGGLYTYYFSWGGSGTDQSGIINNTSGTGELSLDGTGWNIDTSTWTSGILSDFAGKSNSNVIKGITTNGYSSSTTIAPMAYLLNVFNASDCPQSVNQGYTD